MEAVLRGHGVVINDAPYRDAVPVTHCSKTKEQGGDVAVPKDFYVSGRNLRFYDACEARGLPYGILSDQYGIHWHDELKPFYDVFPGQLKDEQLWELGQIIGEKCRERGVTSLFYVASPPTTSAPYHIMLLASGIPYTYATRFSIYDGEG
jgi:hypothetical protein